MDLYGGMGSFFDIGYGSEFYNLKNLLYEECINLRIKYSKERNTSEN